MAKRSSKPGGPIDTENVLNCIFGVRTLFVARLETNGFQDGLARNAHRASSAIRRNLRAQLRATRAQIRATSRNPGAILTTAPNSQVTSSKSARNVSGVFFAKKHSSTSINWASRKETDLRIRSLLRVPPKLHLALLYEGFGGSELSSDPPPPAQF